MTMGKSGSIGLWIAAAIALAVGAVTIFSGRQALRKLAKLESIYTISKHYLALAPIEKATFCRAGDCMRSAIVGAGAACSSYSSAQLGSNRPCNF